MNIYIHQLVTTKFSPLEILKRLVLQWFMIAHCSYLSGCSNMQPYLGMEAGEGPRSIINPQEIINQGRVNTFKSSNGNFLVHLLAFQGELDWLKLALENGADVNAVADNDMQNTPLHLAVNGGHVEVVRLLLDRGVQVDARTADGSTALHLASMKGKENIVKLLLARGADANAENEFGHATYRNFEVMPVPGGNMAMPSDQAERVRQQYGDSNSYVRGCTPLIMAIEEGHVSTVGALLKRGADPTKRYMNTTTSLHEVVAKAELPEETKKAMVELLKKYNADPNANSTIGSPVAQAERSGNENLARAIREKCCNIGCGKTDGILSECACCRRVVYCSKECQKADWDAIHKSVCKLFQEKNKEKEKNKKK